MYRITFANATTLEALLDNMVNAFEGAISDAYKANNVKYSGYTMSGKVAGFVLEQLEDIAESMEEKAWEAADAYADSQYDRTESPEEWEEAEWDWIEQNTEKWG